MQDIRNFYSKTTTVTTTTVAVRAESPASSPRKRKTADAGVLSSSGAVNKLTLAEATELWTRLKAEKEITGKAGCWIHPNKPNDKGYVQIAKDSDKKVYTHHLAVRMVFGSDAVPKDRNRNVSHLCNNASCCNPDHLVVESSDDNHARKNCPVSRQVTCPCGCNHSFAVSVCSHTPPCIDAK